jgi:uncharacterized protein (TIGR00730 family)
VSGEPAGRGPLRVCVFCSSSEDVDARLLDQGVRLGGALARAGHRLVYGGTALGTMGAVATAARAAGGHVTGVLPSFLVERGIADEDCDELVVTEDLLDRKREMLRRSDAFVALPGGLGTLDELLEVVTHVHLGQLAAPVVLLDDGGFWASLLALLDDLRDQGLARAPTELLQLVEDVDRAVAGLERPPRRTPGAVWRA